MKSSLATSLSIAGVIAAGGVAMGLNTAVLTSKSGGSDLVQQVLDQTATTVAGGDSGDVVEAAAQNAPAVAETTTFTIGSAGTVTVTVLGANLEVTDITAGTGWTAGPPRYADATHAKVHFTSSAQRLEVKIALVDGVPQVTVEDDSGAPAPGYPADDHQDDEDHDDEDHEHEHDDDHDGEHDGEHDEEGDDD